MSEDDLTPAQRMAAFKKQMSLQDTALADFLDTLKFPPDDFQMEALEKVALGDSVLVSAPTGAGKTVVGEGAAYIALAKGERVFYTTPIKALSNQKFRDFQDEFGRDNVGLLTGDTAVAPDAKLVVMTTEVLRNMIYANQDLSEVGVVVLDEVHYLADRFRGPVWEEVLIQLPAWVQIVALSATVSNVEEFAGWISSVRGSCEQVVSFERPVPLYQHMLVGNALYDLYSVRKSKGQAQLNPDLLAAVSGGDRRSRGGAVDQRRPRRTASRPAQVRILDRANLLPGIVFIFSRAGCDDAAQYVAGADLSLTTGEERRRIKAQVDEALSTIPVEDQAALGLVEWGRNLEQGVAAHHAGLLPIMKETVEKLFTEGLLKVVYATETLALGINMPARSVVLESLEKWDGSEHVRLVPTEYTQLTGRAGRRGIDVEGHAIVLDRPYVTPEEVSALASGRAYPLRSAFQPNYNMAVNLLKHRSKKQVNEVLESSFAQYQADASVVKLAQKLRKATSQVEEASADLHCDLGDAAEYFELREQISKLQKDAARAERSERNVETQKALGQLRLGDVISFRRGRRTRRAVVVSPVDQRAKTPLARVVAEDGKPGNVGPREVAEGVEVVGRVWVPKGGARRPRDRHRLAAQVREIPVPAKGPGRKRKPGNPHAERLLGQAKALEQELAAHPVHACPQREAHAPAGHRYVRGIKEQERLARQINERTSHLVEDFGKVTQVLSALDFLEGEQVTSRGDRLTRIFGERDLVIALALAEQAWDDLQPEELAAIVAAVVHEPRGEEGSGGESTFMPTARLQDAWVATQRAYDQVAEQERKAGRVVTQPPSAATVQMTYQWAKGVSLADILYEYDLSGGDFVREIRRVIDMLEQLRRLQDAELTRTANEARKKLLRGVVAWTELE